MSYRFLLVFLLTFVSTYAEVTVTAVFTQINQPPLIIDENSGIVPDIINALDRLESGYAFKLVVIPAARIPLISQDKYYDILLFYNRQWISNPEDFEETPNLIQSKDVFIAQKKPGRGEEFFDQLGKVSLVGVLGFNYKFAQFERDQDFLLAKFKMHTVMNELTVVKMIKAQRAEMGIISTSYYEYLKKSDPDLALELLVSKRFDSDVGRAILVRKKGDISAGEMTQFLKTLSSKGVLKQIFEKYGLKEPVLP